MAFLYFKNTTATGVWNDVTNWFTDDACTTQAANVPWVSGDSTYLGYDLTRSTDSITAEDAITIDADIGNGLIITGECDIGVIGNSPLTNTFTIYSGTFSGPGFTNSNGYIYDGVFSGDFFVNSGYIYDGVFSGEYFYNYNGYVYDGTFSGDNFTNEYTIYNGTFSGNYFTNLKEIYSGTFSGDGFANQYSIYGGVFSGNSFANSTNGNIFNGIFTGTGFNNSPSGVIYNGVFSGENFNNYNIINGGIFTGNNFSDSNNIYGGNWLESGYLDVDIFEYSLASASPTITGQIRIEGSGANPYPFDLAVLQGFMTLKIKGQDVLGGGLI